MDVETSRKSEDQVRPRATVLFQCIYGPENVRKVTWVCVFIFIRGGMRVQHLKVYILRVVRYVFNWHQWCEKSKRCSGLLIDSRDRSLHTNLQILTGGPCIIALLVIRTFLLVSTHYRTDSTTKRFAVQFSTKCEVTNRLEFRDTVSSEQHVICSGNEEDVAFKDCISMIWNLVI